jgi:quercetin dioxygenase-like cupin family protein
MSSGDDPATFTDAHAFIVGPGGLEDRDDAEIGVSLLAPNVRYPDHHHPPPEVYLAMTPGAWRKNDGPWIEPGIGGTIFNEPNVVHAMKSDSAPLFAFWCLLLK